EPGRAELALVPAERRPGTERVRRAGGREHVRRGRVDLGVPAAAPLVGEAAGVADAGDDEPVADEVQAVAVAREPAQRPDGAGAPEEAVGVPERAPAERL